MVSRTFDIDFTWSKICICSLGHLEFAASPLLRNAWAFVFLLDDISNIPPSLAGILKVALFCMEGSAEDRLLRRSASASVLTKEVEKACWKLEGPEGFLVVFWFERCVLDRGLPVSIWMFVP